MTAIRLSTIRVKKPWGRHQLWPGFDNPAPGDEPVGEIWFDSPDGSEAALMVKYLFTSERLSIQVHPDDDVARASGHARGKDEAWIILDAESDAKIALGTIRPMTSTELRLAALDGSIERLMHWQKVKAGQVIYSPAGVVHALGAGLTLVEIQQNVDLTYRLYDYGRPRELHLDDGIAVSDPKPFEIKDESRIIDDTRTILFEGKKFVTEKWSGQSEHRVQSGWFSPLTGKGIIDGQDWTSGECWFVEDQALIQLQPEARALFSYLGSTATP